LTLSNAFDRSIAQMFMVHPGTLIGHTTNTFCYHYQLLWLCCTKC